MSLLEINNLKVHFKTRQGGKVVRAVDGVTLNLERGDSVGLVGESGCGKSTIGNAIVKLVPVTDGNVRFEHNDINSLRGGSLMTFREQVQMIFQDPFSSLNPRLSVRAALAEVLRVHGKGKTSEAGINSRINELMTVTGLDPEYAGRYPHEFSGGQRQRIGIARALAVAPSLIIADEAVSALDVSVQVQILNLMKDLQKKLDLSYLFIAHDLAVVRYLCSRVLVMYLGRIVESAPVDCIFERPSHPYTEALLSAVPDVDKGLRSRTEPSTRIVLQGDVPSPVETVPGCPFHPRCHRVRDICRTDAPPMKKVEEDHVSVCHIAESMFKKDLSDS